MDHFSEIFTWSIILKRLGTTAANMHRGGFIFIYFLFYPGPALMLAYYPCHVFVCFYSLEVLLVAVCKHNIHNELLLSGPPVHVMQHGNRSSCQQSKEKYSPSESLAVAGNRSLKGHAEGSRSEHNSCCTTNFTTGWERKHQLSSRNILSTYLGKSCRP